jgi:hypothetical protein
MAHTDASEKHGWGYSEEKAIIDLLEQLGTIVVTRVEPPTK